MNKDGLDRSGRNFVNGLTKNQAYRVLMEMRRRGVVESASSDETVANMMNRAFDDIGDAEPHEAVRYFLRSMSDEDVAQLISAHRQGEFPDSLPESERPRIEAKKMQLERLQEAFERRERDEERERGERLRLLLLGDTSELSKRLAIGEGTIRTMGGYILGILLRHRAEATARRRLTQGRPRDAMEALIDSIPEAQLRPVLRYLLNELSAQEGKPGTPSIVTTMLDRVYEHMGESGVREAAKAVAALVPDVDIVEVIGRIKDE